MARVAIWSNENDPAKDLLARTLQATGHEALTVNTGPEVADEIQLQLHETGIVEATLGGQDVMNLDLVIYRKPTPPRLPGPEHESRFLAREIMVGTESLLRLSGAPWVNEPHCNHGAAQKLHNLHRAHQLGLRIPRTAVGTRVAFEATSRLVGKAVSHGLMTRMDGASMMFVERLPPDFDPSTHQEPGVPMIIQTEIEAVADVRVTIIGEEVLVAERPRPTEGVDWRAVDESPWYPSSIDGATSRQLQTMMARSSLSYAAFDLLRTESGYVFLEMNPNGQWAWLELEAGLPISAAFAALVEDA